MIWIDLVPLPEGFLFREFLCVYGECPGHASINPGALCNSQGFPQQKMIIGSSATSMAGIAQRFDGPIRPTPVNETWQKWW